MPTVMKQEGLAGCSAWLRPVLDEEAHRILGVAQGNRSVTCGDWAVALAETNPITKQPW